MKNIMDMYLNFTEKKLKKYLRTFYGQFYDSGVVSEYLKTYINARYYNIVNTDKPARAFYSRILDEIEFKEKILIKRNEEKTQDIVSKQNNIKFINSVKEVFAYILFFDDVRKISNFKNIKSIRDIVEKIIDTISKDYNIKTSKDFVDTIYKEISGDMIDKELFLEKFETDEFNIEFEIFEQKENCFFATLDHNVKMPSQFSDSAIERVFCEGIVAEDKLQVEYTLLSLIVLRDIINGEFKDVYIAEFAETLFKKKTKLDSLLSLIDNQALQEKISININYSDYIKNQKIIFDYINRGFDFSITLDNKIKGVEDVENLKMFKIVIARDNLVLYKELKKNKNLLKNVIFK